MRGEQRIALRRFEWKSAHSRSSKALLMAAPIRVAGPYPIVMRLRCGTGAVSDHIALGVCARRFARLYAGVVTRFAAVADRWHRSNLKMTASPLRGCKR